MKQILAAILLTSGLLQAQCPNLNCDCPGKWTEIYNSTNTYQSSYGSFVGSMDLYKKWDFEIKATHEICGEVLGDYGKVSRFSSYVRDKKISTWTTEEAAKKAVETECLVPKIAPFTPIFSSGGIYSSSVSKETVKQ